MANAAPDSTVVWQDLPVVRDAARALLANFTQWQQLPARIETAGHQALVVEDAAAHQGNGGVLAAMQDVTNTLAELQHTFWTTSPKVGQVVHALSQEGGGASLDIVMSAVDVWATMRGALATMDSQDQALALAAPVVLTPQEVAALQIGPPNPLGDRASLLVYAVAGLAVWVLFGRRRRA